MPELKFTKAAVERLQLPPGFKQVYYYDTVLPGFAICLGKRAKTYLIHHDLWGRSTKITIGRTDHWEFETAKKEARRMLALMAQGTDPRRKRDEGETATLKDALDKYAQSKELKLNTLKDIRQVRERYLLGWMGRRLFDLTQQEILEEHRRLGLQYGKATANKVLRYLRAVCSWSMVYYGLPSNPVQALTLSRSWFRSNRRRTLLRPHELPRWWSALQAEDSVAKDLMTWLLFTGMRISEGVQLKWAQIDLEGRLFVIADTKNGQPLELPLSDELLEMLKKRKAESKDSPWVFPGRSDGDKGHITEPKKVINRVEARCGLRATPHDLRRTFVTIAESLDIPAYCLKMLLNHSVGNDVTAGYIVISLERLRGPVQRIASHISSLLSGDLQEVRNG